MCRIAFIISLVIISAHTVLGLSGSGTEAEPWRIETLEDFNEFAADANYWAGYTRLETDVNLAGLIYTTAVIAPDIDNTNIVFDGIAFEGVFDGNDHKILNLTIDGGDNNDFLGLFGCIEGFGEVKNLGLEGGSISGDCKVGGLVGESWWGIVVVSNCYSNAYVKGFRDVGGMVGSNIMNIVLNCQYSGFVSGDEYVGGITGGNLGIILNCYSDGSVSGDEYVGGLVGENGGSVSDCFSASSVNGTLYVGGLLGVNLYKVLNSYSTGDVNGIGDYVGGLIGRNHDGGVYYCYSTSNVIGGWFVGGLVGHNYRGYYGRRVSNCYSTGDVSGFVYVGGLVGLNGWEDPFGWNSGYIYNSYSTGSVKGGYRGGLVGVHIEGDIEGSFWDIETSGQVESGGGTGKTTAEMKTEGTFTDAGWDFVEIWDIGERQTYPFFRQYLSVDMNNDGVINMPDFAIMAGHWLEGVNH